MKSIHGQNKIKTEFPDLLYDESRFNLGIPEVLYFPETTADIVMVIKETLQQSRCVTLIGAQTGITGGAVPTEHSSAVTFRFMNRILRVEKNTQNEPVLYCQPGVTLESIDQFCMNPHAFPYVAGIEHLGTEQWFYPPDPTEMSAQLGGTVATNASGARSFKFGPTRHHIENLTLVLASGETLTLHRNHHRFNDNGCVLTTDQGNTIQLPALSYTSFQGKNAAGYFCAPHMDCIDLFIGSEGTLGIIAEIGIRLKKKPTIIGGLSFFPSRNDALNCADILRNNTAIASLEYFDSSALRLLNNEKDIISLSLPSFPAHADTALYWEYITRDECTDEAFFASLETTLSQCSGSLETTWSGFDDGEIKKIKTFRHAVPELVNAKISLRQKQCAEIRKISTDAAVPPGSFREIFDLFIDLLDTASLETVVFGHCGDYHLHFNILPRSEEELKKALKVYDTMMNTIITHKGTVSAEHGIGKLKRNYLASMYGKETLEEMKKIKHLLDPAHILSPQNLFIDNQI